MFKIVLVAFALAAGPGSALAADGCTIRFEQGLYSIIQRGQPITSGVPSFEINLGRYRDLVSRGTCSTDRVQECLLTFESGLYLVTQRDGDARRPVTGGVSSLDPTVQRLKALKAANACMHVRGMECTIRLDGNLNFVSQNGLPVTSPTSGLRNTTDHYRFLVQHNVCSKSSRECGVQLVDGLFSVTQLEASTRNEVQITTGVQDYNTNIQHLSLLQIVRACARP